MKLYLASKYTRKEEMRGIRDKLEVFGHEVTSRWLEESEAPDIQVHDVEAATLAGYAEHDIEDIEAADAVVHFQRKDSPNKRGGALVECGVGIGMGRQAILVGDRVNIFDFLPSVMVFETVDEFLDWASEESLDEMLGRPGVKTAYKRIKEAESPAGGRPVLPTNCWCGKALTAEGLPDFPGDAYPVTMHYECPVHERSWQKPMGIGISGKARSGKDTLADVLSLALDWATAAFADALKVEWYKQSGLPPSEPGIIEAVDREKLKCADVRQQLIYLGQKRREEDPLYWVKRVDISRPCIVSDVRFPNEAQYLIENGFFMVRIEATPHTLTKRGCPPIDDKSENSLDNWPLWDYVVHNNSDFAWLRSEAAKVAEIIQGEDWPMNK